MGSSVLHDVPPANVPAHEVRTDTPLASAELITPTIHLGLRYNDQNLFGDLEISYPYTDCPGSHFNRERMEVSFLVHAKPDGISEMDLVVFERDGPRHRLIPMKRISDDGFSVTVKGEGFQPGLAYGYIPKGDKLDSRRVSWLSDPHAEGIIRPPHPQWLASLLLNVRPNLAPDAVHYYPNKSVVVDREDLKVLPLTLPPLGAQVFYEIHVKDTMDFPSDLLGSDEVDLYGQQGTVAFLTNRLLQEHFKRLGVTTCEMMPIQCFETSWRTFSGLAENVWGYLPSQLKALHPEYFNSVNPDQQIVELNSTANFFRARQMNLIADLVLGHTHALYRDTGDARRDNDPSLFKGPAEAMGVLYPEQYFYGDIDATGCGHTINASSPLGRKLVLDSVRFFEALGLGGGRYDQATTIGRELQDHGLVFNPKSETLNSIPKADTISIAEPNDMLGFDEMGRFPKTWLEWHYSARDGGNAFFRGLCTGRDIASRFQGNTDLYPGGLNRGINFIAIHDGHQAYDAAVEIFKSRNPEGGVEASIPEVMRITRALHSFVIFAPGPLMLSRGNEYGRSQDGKWDPFNDPKYLGLDFRVIAAAQRKDIPSAMDASTDEEFIFNQRVALLRFIYDSMALRKNLQVFETKEQFDLKALEGPWGRSLKNAWMPYGMEGHSIEDHMRKLQYENHLEEGPARGIAWDHLDGFLGNCYSERPSDIASDVEFCPVYVAFWNHNDIVFKLPRVIPESGLEWQLCANTAAGEVCCTDPYKQDGQDVPVVEGEPDCQEFRSVGPGSAVFQLRPKRSDSKYTGRK